MLIKGGEICLLSLKGNEYHEAVGTINAYKDILSIINDRPENYKTTVNNAHS